MFRDCFSLLTVVQETPPTNDGFKFASYEHIPLKPYDRKLYWRASGNGSYLLTPPGDSSGQAKKTISDNTSGVGVDVGANCGLLVMKTWYKLVPE